MKSVIMGSQEETGPTRRWAGGETGQEPARQGQQSLRRRRRDQGAKTPNLPANGVSSPPLFSPLPGSCAFQSALPEPGRCGAPGSSSYSGLSEVAAPRSTTHC